LKQVDICGKTSSKVLQQEDQTCHWRAKEHFKTYFSGKNEAWKI